MTVASNTSLPRRSVIVGALTGAIAIVTGLALYEAPRFFAPRYAPTPFDDLLALLPDRDSAIRIGSVARAGQKSWNANETASRLRSRLRSKTLATALADDLRTNGTVEVGGWILPETLAQLCTLTTKS